MNKKIIVVFILFVLVGTFVIYKSYKDKSLEQGHVVAYFDGYEAIGDGEFNIGDVKIEPSSPDVESISLGSGTSSYRFSIPNQINPYEKIVINFKVKNTGSKSERFMVVVYRYWLNEDGDRVLYDTSPIVVNYGNLDDFIIDDEASTNERTVMYYKKALDPFDISDVIIESISFNYDSNVTCNPGYVSDNVLVSNCRNESPEFENGRFVVEIEIRSVQDYHCEDAVQVAWGVTDDFANLICSE